MVVFTIIFGKVAKLPSDTGVPYPIMVFAAMLPWQLFATSFQEGSNSLVNNSSLISKVYFPRIIIPVSTIVVSLIDFLISFILLIGLMIWFRYLPTVNIFAIPILIVYAVLPSIGVGLWIASLNVRYRDFKFIVPFIVQFGLYISPVGFSSSVVPVKLRYLYSINPMVGVIDGFRWAVTGNNAGIFFPGLCISIVLSFVLLITGFWYFRKTERTFADVI
jgi:lipopolysaccharide transport system permease protein